MGKLRRIDDFIGRLTPAEHDILDIFSDVFFEYFPVTEVNADEDGSFHVMSKGCGFWTSNPNGGKPPKVGDTLRVYHTGTHGLLGSTIRGVALDDNGEIGLIYRYNTPIEQAFQDFKEYCAYIRKEQEKWLAYEPEYRKAVAELPEPFQRRLARFERNVPDFGQQFGGYELMCCQTAVDVASKFPTEEAISKFYELDWGAQIEQYPPASEHSNNSWGAANRLAYLYVTRPELVEYEHGAMHFLTGCEEYGCYAAYKDGSLSESA